MEKGIESLPANGPARHQIVTEPCASLGLQLKCGCHLRGSDKLCLNQKITQPQACFDGVLPAKSTVLLDLDSSAIQT